MGGRFGELIVILLIVLVLFGAGKIPRIMADIGKGLRAFRRGLDDGDVPPSSNDEIKKKDDGGVK